MDELLAALTLASNGLPEQTVPKLKTFGQNACGPDSSGWDLPEAMVESPTIAESLPFATRHSRPLHRFRAAWVHQTVQYTRQGSR